MNWFILIVLFIVMIIGFGETSRRGGSRTLRPTSRDDDLPASWHLVPRGFLRTEYERARLKGEVSEGFEQWSAEQLAIAEQQAFEKQVELGLLHQATKRDGLTRETGRMNCELGILPAEAALYRRCFALNVLFGSGGYHLYVSPVRKLDDEQKKANEAAIRQLEREWCALHVNVSDEYWAEARRELDEKHGGKSYTLHFTSGSGETHYPWTTGHWRAVSTEWSCGDALNDGRPIDSKSTSANGAVVALFRAIDKRSPKKRIQHEIGY
jgi:hypothetical protein